MLKSLKRVTSNCMDAALGTLAQNVAMLHMHMSVSPGLEGVNTMVERNYWKQNKACVYCMSLQFCISKLFLYFI